MKKLLFAVLILLVHDHSAAQSKEAMQQYVERQLGYKHMKYKVNGKECEITIYKVSFDKCTMQYSIYNRSGNQPERYTVSIYLPGITAINMGKSKEGYNNITFTTNRKSILKEFGEGDLVRDKQQFIPVKALDEKALDYLRKLQVICTNR